MNELLTLEHVRFSYENRKVIDDLSLHLTEGDFLGILGPNGSGKTTLLRIMAGVLKPQGGEVTVKEKSLSAYSSRQRAKVIAMVPQELDILFPFTVLEVVLMGRWPYLKPLAWESEEDLRVAKDAMAATDCLPFADRLITELSGGEKERVILARALAQEPEILILDEPTNHLDLKHQIQTYNLLLKLNREKKITVVVVLHDLNFAMRACQHILLLQQGRCVRMGKPLEVMDGPTLEAVFEAPLQVEKDSLTQQPFFLPRIGA